MWFLFGFLTVTAVIIGTVLRVFDASWKGENSKVGGLDYQYQEYREENAPKWFRIGVVAPVGYNFALKPETSTDGFFKSIGISNEQQLSDEAFDRAIYIVSDDASMCRRLAKQVSLRDALLALFSEGDGPPYVIKGLRCAAGRIWFRYRACEGFETKDARRLAERLVPVLHGFSKVLAELPAEPGPGKRDPFVPRALAILAISSGLTVNAVMQLYRIYWNELPFLEDPWAPVLPAALLGAGIVAVLSLVTVKLLGRGARTHLVLLEILILGSFGSAVTSYVELRDLNMEFDKAPPKAIAVGESRKFMRTSRRFPRYYISVRDWSAVTGSRDVRIPLAAYNQLQSGDSVTINVKPGFAGYPWVESIEGPRDLRID